MADQRMSALRAGITVAIALLASGCGSDSAPPNMTDATAGDASVDGSGGNPSPEDASIDTVLGAVDARDRFASGGNDGPAAQPDADAAASEAVCQGDVTAAGPPAELLVVLDRSASMADPPNGMIASDAGPSSKWAIVAAGLADAIDATSSTIAWGLKIFPEGLAACSATSVTRAIDVPVGASNGPAIEQAIMAGMPNGDGTPAAAALDVAAAYLRARPADRPKYLMLVTDGVPTCSGTLGTTIATGSTSQATTDAVNVISLAAQAGIPTFVVGLESISTSAVAALNAMAVAGLEVAPDSNPLATRYYAATTPEGVAAAVRAIVPRAQSCAIPMGGADAGIAADFADDFEDGNADGWIAGRTGTATWSVVADGSNHVLQGTANDLATSWIAAGNAAWRDQMVTARIQLAPAADASAALSCVVLLAARFVDERTQDYVQLSTNGTLELRQKVNGGTLTFATVPSAASLAAGSIVTLGISVRGQTLTAYVNGNAVATGTEPTPGPASGGIALGMSCPTAAWFDDVRVVP